MTGSGKRFDHYSRTDDGGKDIHLAMDACHRWLRLWLQNIDELTDLIKGIGVAIRPRLAHAVANEFREFLCGYSVERSTVFLPGALVIFVVQLTLQLAMNGTTSTSLGVVVLSRTHLPHRSSASRFSST